jgi:hypothetical protein
MREDRPQARDAVAALRAALREQLEPLDAEWRLLAQEGRFEEAWRVSDRALAIRRGVDCSHWPRHQQFVWDGSPLENRRVLIRCYHGLGDTVQFVRFVPAVCAIAREVTLWAQPALLPLLSCMGCANRVLPLHDGAPEVEYDVDVELCELLHVFRVTCDSLGQDVPYLHVEHTAAPRGSCLRVGLVWTSGEWDHARSIPQELLAPLGALEGIEWHLMQRGPAAETWRQAFGRAPAMASILDEACALRSLDLLISVDTCSAHLGGALGVPVWLLLRNDADWRWQRDRTDSPWYPGMRLFRQARAGDWSSPLSEVGRELARLQAGS